MVGTGVPTHLYILLMGVCLWVCIELGCGMLQTRAKR